MENYHKECLFGCWMDTMILLVCLGKSICQGQTFVVLLVLLIVTAFADGGSIFFFYTQWTFTLVTIYFGLGSLLSMYGCYQYHKRVGGNRIDNDGLDEEQGTPTHEISSTMPNVAKISGPREGSHHAQKTAGMWSYVFQIIFQVCSSISELCRSRSSSSISMISECKARADIPNPEELFARLVVLLHDPLARGQLATQILKNRAYIQRRS